MKHVVVIRTYDDGKEKLGYGFVFDGLNKLYEGKTLELPWRDNRRRISCVPADSYLLELEYSPRFKEDLWELKDVEDRSECKFHAANWVEQLNGCISNATSFKDLNKDGRMDVAKSRLAMNKFHDALSPDRRALLTIIDLTDIEKEF